MKKILIASNILLLTILLFMACNNSPQKKDSVKEANASTDKPVVRDSVEDEVMSGLIDDNLAVAMSKAYKNDRNKSYVTGTNEPDARSIWFSLTKLKSFIAKIEESTAGSKNDLHLGVRMYYAKYPSLEEITEKYPSLLAFSQIAGKHTLFMTPTYRTEKEEDIDFNFENVGNRDKPTPYATLLTATHGRAANHIFSNLEIAKLPRPTPGGSIPRVENHGGLMPPPASGGTFPTGEEQ